MNALGSRGKRHPKPTMGSIAQEKHVTFAEAPAAAEPAAEPKKRRVGVNPWMVHVKAFRAAHPELKYKEVLKQAKLTYKKE